MLSKSNRFVSIVLLSALGTTPALAAGDAAGIALEGGWSEDGHDICRGGIAFQSDVLMPSFTFGNLQLAGYWELSASYWGSAPGSTQTDALADFGLTPFLRLQPAAPLAYGLRPFLEGGVGVHATTEDRINDKIFGSEFTFGNHAGVGVRYQSFDISYRFQHLSNAGLADPNAGINFHLVRLGYHF